MQKLLVLAVLCGVLAMAAPAAAQNGACPPGSYSLGSPAGIYPDSMNICASDLSSVSVVPNEYPNEYPCDQRVRVNWNTYGEDDHGDYYQTPYTIFVPDSNTRIGQLATLRTYVYAPGRPALLGGYYDYLDHAVVHFQSYGPDGAPNGVASESLAAVTQIDTYHDHGGLPINYYYRVYYVDVLLPFDALYGGYVISYVRIPKSGPDWGQISSYSLYYSSTQIAHEGDVLPSHCPIPNASVPATPYPTPTPATPLPPTWTPYPAGTFTPTPITTPVATSAGVTPPPTWTATPIVFPTTDAEPTPTAWPLYNLPPVTFPTPSFATPLPTLMAAGIPTIDASGTGLDILKSEIEEAWATPLAASGTITTGVDSPANTVVQLTHYVGLPFAYAKGLQSYMPNAYGYLMFLMGLAGFVVFNIVTKYGLGIAKFVFELIRRIWEAVPFIG